jgi:hypothetical protein
MDIVFFVTAKRRQSEIGLKKPTGGRNAPISGPIWKHQIDYPAKNPASHPMTLSHRMTCRVFSRIINLIFTEH